MELNSDNPIFAYYVDVSGLSAQHSANVFASLKESFSQYTNITVWIIAADYTKVECIYYNKDKRSEKLIKAMESIIDSPTEFKQRMREILIEDIIDE